MKKVWATVAGLCLAAALWAKDNRTEDIERLQAATTVLDEVMSAPDRGVPEEIFTSAECVAVVPSLLKGGFIFGGAYGKGVATCRTQSPHSAPAQAGATGAPPQSGWSAPAFFRIEGGSFGLQIGGQAVDLVMIVMNERGMRALLSSKFKLGVDASVAAGPVGRHAEGMTDWKMRAQVLTYSRARGVFAGIALNGAAIRQDKDDTRAFYGRMVPFRTSLTGLITPPADAQSFLAAVARYSSSAAAKK